MGGTTTGTGSGAGGSFGGGMGQGGRQYDMEVRRDSQTAGGFFDNVFGGHTVHVTEQASPHGGARAGGQQQPGAAASHYQQQHDAHGGVDPHTGHLRSNPDMDAGGSDVVADNLDLDQLAGQLYDRLRSRLRREFLVDRERSGLLTDYR